MCMYFGSTRVGSQLQSIVFTMTRVCGLAKLTFPFSVTDPLDSASAAGDSFAGDKTSRIRFCVRLDKETHEDMYERWSEILDLQWGACVCLISLVPVHL